MVLKWDKPVHWQDILEDSMDTNQKILNKRFRAIFGLKISMIILWSVILSSIQIKHHMKNKLRFTQLQMIYFNNGCPSWKNRLEINNI